MIVDKSILIGLGIIIGFYLLYKLFFSETKQIENEFDKYYNKVLSSEETKVKGQYDK